ncbi:hypothetical protein EXIGLDRAFT_473420 [Exidia glandulosa HHB12029]|uniref:Uncharacterized protein n=1 Tax=Exidia glandulosa HHB12029 TaxID=1314781 RepID=A0A165JYB9_EXIGL|nr:hypothetical protein EXIGLDRAFT_473420 [Exidia glandulosa HHB12029]
MREISKLSIVYGACQVLQQYQSSCRRPRSDEFDGAESDMTPPGVVTRRPDAPRTASSPERDTPGHALAWIGRVARTQKPWPGTRRRLERSRSADVSSRVPRNLDSRGAVRASRQVPSRIIAEPRDQRSAAFDGIATTRTTGVDCRRGTTQTRPERVHELFLDTARPGIGRVWTRRGRLGHRQNRVRTASVG